MFDELQDRSYDLISIGGVKFSESSHTYTNDKGEIYRSSTGILKEFKNPFPTIEVSRYKAIKEVLSPKDFSRLKSKAGGWDKVKNYWDILINHSDALRLRLTEAQQRFANSWLDAGELASTKGSIEHNRRENIIKSSGIEWMNKYYEYSSKNILEVNKTDSCIIPEILLWNHGIKLGGLADCPIFDSGYVHILDYKTNKEIKTSAFNDQKMKKFLSHLPDCSLYHYSLQLKIYQKLACMLTGLKPGECWIISTANPEYGRLEDQYTECVNLDKEVDLIFEYYANN